jgi:ABC-type transport system involved in cytochrome c biogenesis permease subunit
MKKWLPWIIVAVFAAWVAGSLRMPPDKTWAYNEFGRLPVIYEGRVKPFDTLARNALLQLRDKQTANLESWKEWYQSPKIISATEWLLAVMMRPEIADTWKEFRIDNPDVKGLLGLPVEPNLKEQQDGKHFSWLEIQPKLADLKRETARASQVEAAHRSRYDQALMKLWAAQLLYVRLKNTLGPAADGNLDADLQTYTEKVMAARTALVASQKNERFDASALDWLEQQWETPLIVPVLKEDSRTHWRKAVESVALTANTGAPLDPALIAFDKISRAYRADNPGEFNSAVREYHAELAGNFSPELAKMGHEEFFNYFEPFYKAMVIDVCAFLLVLAYWFEPKKWDWMRLSAIGLVILAWAVHTSGLVFRMVLQGRPPVTNLYSSAIFIGWGAIILGLLLEYYWRNSIGVMVSSIMGFLTLIIAHNLSLSGDTMEMLRAVLDTNFWLATHVVVVTLGYASTFVAGMLAIIYIIKGVFTRSLTPEMSKSVARMIYGIICFAALFSFVGTVLGGIWADQSWGRFWGWDPKENGAVIIVLWNALILHARWGGMVRERGLANLAIVGNIVTSWSWFGVNMLGIGLHSYGFTDAAFVWLLIFVASQLCLLGFGLLPKRMWQSSLAAAAQDREMAKGGGRKTAPAV